VVVAVVPVPVVPVEPPVVPLAAVAGLGILIGTERGTYSLSFYSLFEL